MDEAIWHPLITTARSEARALLRCAMALQPRLTRTGIGLLNEEFKRAAIIELELFEERIALESHVEAVAACADWIKLQRRVNTFAEQTSFKRKTNVETWFQLRNGPPLGISNGAFIAAALGLDIEGRIHRGGPNMLFKLVVGPANLIEWERERVKDEPRATKQATSE